MFINYAIYFLGISYSLLTIWYAYSVGIQRSRFTVLMIGVGVGLFYLIQIEDILKNRDTTPQASGIDAYWSQTAVVNYLPLWRARILVCIGWFILVTTITAFIQLNYSYLYNEARVIGLTDFEALIGIIMILAVTDATRRAYGNIVAFIPVLSVAYALAGPYLPSVFFHSGLSLTRIGGEGAMNFQGLYGFISEVGVTWVAIFIIFAGMAKSYGLMDLVLQISEEVSKKLRTGVVQFAVIASVVMGSITGSAAANSATTGSFTIPMMKQQGLDKNYAAAIESVASSGGQIMPPIMGVAAFLMADIIGIPFADVVKSATIPAFLFYTGTVLAVHIVTHKFAWLTEQGTFDLAVLRPSIPFFPPFFVLVYTLLYLRYSPLTCGLYTIAALIVSMWVWDLSKGIVADANGPGISSVVSRLVRETAEGLTQGARDMAPLLGILSSLGVVVTLIARTGLTQQISTQMVALSGGVFIMLLFLSMVTSILFGLGLPTPAAYLLVVVLVAPALIGQGVQELTAHFFVFYFAMISAITPPVAIAVAVTSEIAGSNFLRTCWHALRIGCPGFIVPYAFITNESLIFWTFPATIFTTIFVLSGILALLLAVFAYDGRAEIGVISRVGLFIVAFVSMFGPMSTQIVAVSLLGTWLLLRLKFGYSLPIRKPA